MSAIDDKEFKICLIGLILVNVEHQSQPLLFIYVTRQFCLFWETEKKKKRRKTEETVIL